MERPIGRIGRLERLGLRRILVTALFACMACGLIGGAFYAEWAASRPVMPPRPVFLRTLAAMSHAPAGPGPHFRGAVSRDVRFTAPAARP